MTQQTPPLPTLPLQLMLSLGCWLSSPFAWACAKNAWPSSSSSTPVQNPSELQQAIAQEGKSRATSLLSGILRYYDTPYARAVPQMPCIWRRGNARLLDYGLERGYHDYREPRDYRDDLQPRTTTTTATTITLFIPSLINRYYILDLEEERSMLRFMAAQGIHPLVIDWGTPGEFEASFDCSKYITDILIPAIEFLAQSAGCPITLVGYCMGGNLALAAAQLKPKLVSGIALLATPWNFHCKEFLPFIIDKQWLPMAQSLIAAQQHVPADVIQSLFYMTDPWVFEHKFRRFAELTPKSSAARDFVALEHWVNDGVPLTAPVARDCLLGWAQENQLYKGQWKVDGKNIALAKLKLPTFLALPQSDHVVPRDCALPLAHAMPHANIVYPSAGHVGMIVGSHAKDELWQPLARWLHNLA